MRMGIALFFAGCSNRSSNEAAGESQPEAYPQGYVEDCDEPRTKLGAFFSSLTRRMPSMRTSRSNYTDP